MLRASVDELVERLHDLEFLEPALHSQLLSPDAVPALLAALAREDSWAPIHAANLLAELQVKDAIEPMLRTLREVDLFSILYSTLEEALPEFGAAALEPVLDAYRHATDINERDVNYRDSLCAVMAKLRLRDERIFRCLVEQLEHDVEMGASNLAEYGDPRALEHLYRAFDEYEIAREEDFLDYHASIEMVAAIEELGGSLTSAQQRKHRRSQEPAERKTRQLRDAFAKLATISARGQGKKLGRNEPCWCGSGAKYKKCHLRSDEAERN